MFSFNMTTSINVMIIGIILLRSLQVTVTKIEITLKSSNVSFQRFWRSTGLCPSDPKEEIYKFLLNDEEKINLALIGAVPNRGIQQVRVHWLLDLILMSENGNGYNFTYLDEFLDFLYVHNLKPGFELMGYPIQKNRGGILSGLLKAGRIIDGAFWKELVKDITVRYLKRFGIAEVSSWKFETWNEPDLKNYNLLNFTLTEYLHYVNGCAEGLREAFSAEGAEAAFLGGPAGLFREENHPLCWGLLETCNSSESSRCPIQFISFHRKGDGTAEGVLNGTLELLDLLHNNFSNVAKIPMANDESDVIAMWSKSYEWRADSRYAAMVVKVVADIHKSAIIDRKLKIEVLSNDNGFLNYHPFYFTQRTLFARFQMNHTDPPHNQFIKKPVYSAMALLSFLGDAYLEHKIIPSDPLLTVLGTMTTAPNQTTISVAMAYAKDQQVDVNKIKVFDVVVENVMRHSKLVVYLVDNIVSNPYYLWKRVGKPVFPDRELRAKLRNIEEPHRLLAPTDVLTTNLSIALNLTIPSVALLHVCSKSSEGPGPVSQLSIFNVTGNEVLLTWSDDLVNTKCIRTYEVELESQCANSLQFQRVNPNDVIFLSYHHATTGDGACESTIGKYRVRAVDYWNRPGRYSNIVFYP